MAKSQSQDLLKRAIPLLLRYLSAQRGELKHVQSTEYEGGVRSIVNSTTALVSKINALLERDDEAYIPNPAVVPGPNLSDETDPERMHIPDCWHAAMALSPGPHRDMVLEVWHKAHRLLKHAKEMKRGERFDHDRFTDYGEEGGR